MAKDTILIIGANGQIGIELAENLRKIYGDNHVITSDIKAMENQPGIFETLDIMDKNRLYELLNKYPGNTCIPAGSIAKCNSRKKS